MEIRYDKSADAAYFMIKKGKVGKTKEFADKVLLDLDKNGNILGIELLNHIQISEREFTSGKGKMLRSLKDLS